MFFEEVTASRLVRCPLGDDINNRTASVLTLLSHMRHKVKSF